MAKITTSRQELKTFVDEAQFCLGVLLTEADDDPFENLKFRLLGPAVGGRAARAVGVPGQPLVFYAATAAGGVWKSEDGGVSFKPVFDDQPISSTG